MSQEARPIVLIVDDEPTNVRVLAEVLEGMAELRFATDGQRALELAASLPADLILLDVAMPGIDGFEVLQRLKAAPETISTPVIFVTALDALVDEERGLTLGAVDYIAKPISPPIVRARVRTHLELKRQRDLLERHALLDALTGVGNRRRFDTELATRSATAMRHLGTVDLLMIDVDQFKLYNDHHGHSMGDACLRAVAQALDDCFGRGEDVVTRYGGEEFAVLPGRGDLAEQAARALAAIDALALPHPATAAGRVSISIGALSATPSTTSGTELVEQADQLLYEAKRRGRRRALALAPEHDAFEIDPFRDLSR